MDRGHRTPSLTAAHIKLVHRDIEDQGPPPGQQVQTDEDYADWVARILAAHPAPDRPTHLFVYGSLIWRPEIDHVGERIGVLRGWHSSFCLRQLRFRGSPEFPGLMMSLDEGGECRGVLLELPAEDLEAQFNRLFRREFTVKPNTNTPLWLTVETGTGRVPALTFVMNRESPLYAANLMPEEVADVLAKSCGHLGTGAEYLLNTVTQLESRGIHDPGLWRLQELVAQRIGLI
ncbi:gamma-glutamylcyclotransferase [Palleronia sp. KMU-117]|uniref:gamma-glutamylcyclotransferase n=1 Tax=Palleronia sp. KMU-117 TaxID=3434108 RepID=UPI003D75A853